MVRVPDAPLGEGEFLVRKSNRLTHQSAGGPPLPCGFFLEIMEGNKGRLYPEGDGREIVVPEEMSSLAGSHEARARSKLVDEVAEHLTTDTHAGYIHEYYRIEAGDLILLEWFRQDENSARAYLGGGFEGLLDHCRELERVLEKHFPEPEEIYDYVPRGNGIRSVFHQVYRILSRGMFEEGLDLKTAHTVSRLERSLTIDPSREIRKALNVNSGGGNGKVDLYAVYRDKNSELLRPLREVLPLVEDRAEEH